MTTTATDEPSTGASPDESQKLFRQEALANRESPLEQLDRLLVVTKPRTWLGVGAIALLLIAVLVWAVFADTRVQAHGSGVLVEPDGVRRVWDAEGGLVTDVHVGIGDDVNEGDTLVTMERYDPTSGETTQDALVAPNDGHVLEIDVEVGQPVAPGMEVATIDAIAGNPTRVTAFIPLPEAEQVYLGMPVAVAVSSAPAAQYGSIRGEVVQIGELPVSQSRALKVAAGDEQLASLFLGSGPAKEVVVRLELDPDSASGYLWTGGDGPDFEINHGALVNASVTLEREASRPGSSAEWRDDDSG